MSESLRTTALLAVLVLLVAGCTNSCCEKQDCIDAHGLGDPDNARQWCEQQGFIVYPDPGLPIKIKKPGGPASQIVYQVGTVDQTGLDYPAGTVRMDFVGLQIYEFHCVENGIAHDAQTIEIEHEDGYPRIEITRTPLGTIQWALLTGTARVILGPIPVYPGDPPVTNPENRVPNHIFQGFTGKLVDVGANDRICDEVRLRVYMPQ
jgi:hypothetical protein